MTATRRARPLPLLLALVLAAAGCMEPVEYDTGPADGDGDADGDVDGDAGGDADGDADGGGDADGDAEPDSGGPWVAIVSPRGGEVENPVTFELASGGGVASLALEADGWPLHDEPLPAGTTSHAYRFTGVDVERHVLLIGHDEEGRRVATDEVWLTPFDPAPELAFPISLESSGLTLSNFDSPSCTGSFGASRSGGRLHAGCDLYWTDDGGDYYVDRYHSLNDDLAVFAVADGVITAYYDFYQGTSAVEVDHGELVIRYGEVDSRGLEGGLTVGSAVSAGQRIATMGDLDMGGAAWSMLHFELFSGELTGPLTQSGATYLHVPAGNYQRRGDLMDCTPFLVDLLAASGW